MNNIFGWIIGIAIVYFIFSAIGNNGKYEGQSAEEWYNRYDESETELQNLQTKVEDLESALEEANSNIDDVNSKINSAKFYSWESYEEMGDALDSLSTVSTVSEP